MVQLYSNSGMHLCTLRVPGTQTSALSWEGRGLRLALAVDSCIYLANIRPEYKWAFFGSSTCVYGFKKRDHSEHSVMFWDITTNERYCKYANRLIAVSGAGDHCILATLGDEPDLYVLVLCNAIGNPVDSKTTGVEPLSITMNSNHVFVASEDRVYVWKFKGSSQSLSLSSDSTSSCENVFHIDEPPGYAEQNQDEEIDGGTPDQICCMCCTETYLIVGRESGIMHRYNLPELTLDSKDLLQCRPQVLEMNCNSTRLSVIDVNGVLTFYDLKQAQTTGESIEMSSRVAEFERKDVWSMKWADDNPDLLALMEKTRMYIFRGTDPEEPVSCTGYLCNFHNLQIQAVQLDDVMSEPELPGKDLVFNYETKSLRDTRQMLMAVEIQDAFSYVEEHAHPRLWMSLAEHALDQLNLSIAEKAFVRCQHYYGIQFVKGLHILQEKNKQLAEICVYFERFDAAQKIYVDMDRIDLAIDLRVKMGDWFIVEALISDSGAGNDVLLELTWNNIGNYYADRQSWNKATVYYRKANNSDKLAECHYALQSWSDLEKLMQTLHDGAPLLLTIAKMFASVGICEHAVTGFVRGGDIKSALDCCMELNHWDKAMELARTHDSVKSMTATISKYTKFLLQSGNPLHAVEVYTKAGQHQNAARVLNKLARQFAEKRQSPLEVKKLFVLAALQIEAYRDSVMGCQASWWLKNYEDVMNAEDIYSLIALTTFYNKHYAQCSQAFVKLEALNKINSESKQNSITQLALAIFTQYNPVSPVTCSTQHCPSCGARIQELENRCSTTTCSAIFPICMASGNLIVDDDCVQCTTCKHLLMSSKVRGCKHCPLCHSPLTMSQMQASQSRGLPERS